MARKTKRRVYRRPRPQQRTEDAAQKQQRLDAAARSLLATRSAEQLRLELSEREWQLAEADRLAQLEPNPANLSRYRFARSQHEAAVAAVALLPSRTESADNGTDEDRRS